MEELPAKAKEVMAGAESDYESWKEKVESVLQKAVFNHDTSTATIIYEYLVSSHLCWSDAVHGLCFVSGCRRRKRWMWGLSSAIWNDT